MHWKLFWMMALAAVVTPAFAVEWTMDLEAAKVQAAKEGKPVLISFTGSDWCQVCAQLKRNVFDRPEFSDFVQERFIPVEIDVPRNPKFGLDVLERNHEICAEFGVRGMPTVIVISAEGQVLGGFRGGKRSLPEVCGVLASACDNGTLYREAVKLQGMERAKALHAVQMNIPQEFRFLSDLDKEVRTLDLRNETGVLDPELQAAEWKEFEAYLATARGDAAREDAIIAEAEGKLMPANVERLQGLKEDKRYERLLNKICSLRPTPEAALPLIEEGMAHFTDARRRYELRAFKVEYQIRCARTVEDIMAAKATMLESAEDFPQNAYQIQLNADSMFSEPDRLLEQAKRWRGE